MSQGKVNDLRSALELLKTLPGQYAETDVEVDTYEEIAGVYRYFGAGGTIVRPTRSGPAAVFNNVKGHPGTRCAIGVLAGLERVSAMLGVPQDRIAWEFLRGADHPVPPVVIPGEKASCHEVVHRADDPGFDIRKILPGTRNSSEDAGHYITMGIVRATDPETGESDVTIHRIVFLGPDECGIQVRPGMRHIGDFHKKAEKLGKPLEITVSIGNDPAISIGTCFSAPKTPIGYDELSAVGGFRGEPVELVKALTVNETAIANSEFVIEGMIMPNVRIPEDRETGTGRTMAEFEGYTGYAGDVPQIKVTAVTHRRDPIVQVCLGNSYEHVMMAGIPAAAAILGACETALPGRVVNCYCPEFGGGKYVAFLQIRKQSIADDGEQINAGMLAFSAYRELKHVFLVDEDVDIFDTNDVMWAMTTRFQSHLDTVEIRGAKGHPAEKSAQPFYDPSVYTRGITCKTIFDCTLRYELRDKFRRSPFVDMDYRKWFPQ